MTDQLPIFAKETKTQVHSLDAMTSQRISAFAHDQCVMSGVSIYGQLAVGTALYLYTHVSTPGYLSILLTIPYLLLVYGVSHWLACRARPDQGALVSAVGKGLGRVLAVALALVTLLDGQLALYALCAIISDVLPNISSIWVALAVAILTACSLGGGDEYALPRLSRFLRWLIGLAILYCALSALPYGNPGHLSPLLGHGVGTIFQGALWMCGCVAGAFCPLIMPQARETLTLLRQKRIKRVRPMLCAVGAAVLAALVSAYLLPVYALARPENLGWHMMLLTNLSPSVAGWSMLLWALLFLLLLTLSAGVTRAATLITWVAGKQASSPFLITGLLLLLVPLSALSLRQTDQLLLAVAPWRAAAVLLVLAILAVGSLVKNRGQGKPKEGA